MGAAVVAVLVVVVGVLVMSIPPVVGLGNKVKLPLLHGGSTWVNLMIFTLMGVFGLVYVFTRNERLYAWEVGFRAVAAPLWLVNSVLGFIAASSTWDFSGSKTSELVIIGADPRLRAQILLLFGVAVLLLLDWLVLENRLYKAVADVVFTAAMIVLMSDLFLDPVKRAMHPDSPVLNSGWDIKAPFFGMVVAIFGVMLVLSWLAASTVRPAVTPAATAELPAQ
ncbi:MAG: hypothetical protein P4L93_03035 [Coriobacteriia bacterium]|nr:hypothetical protein [Coriobacteriia bacterium]